MRTTGKRVGKAVPRRGKETNERAEKDARPDEGGKDDAKTDEERKQATTDDEQGQKDAQGHKQAKGPSLRCSQCPKPKAVSTTAGADTIPVSR